ncbi:MAG: hypothetical protein JWN25_98 [Verrucomicrobiales bacterium]|nr:hypothetical protein [Verrucomicrobiales bacterium]
MKIPHLVLAVFVAVTTFSPALLPGADTASSSHYLQAFDAIPPLNPQDRKYLLEKEWRGHPLDSNAGQLLGQHDREFKLLREASKSGTAVDWKMNMSAGPFTPMPQLARARDLAKLCLLRARWQLQSRQDAAASEEIITAIQLGSAVSDQSSMLTASIRLTINDLVCALVAERWFELKNETVQDVLKALDRKPIGGTFASVIRSEKIISYDWLLRIIKEAQAKFPADDKKALQSVSEQIHPIFPDPQNQGAPIETQIITAAGNTTAGLTRYVTAIGPLYTELEQVFRMPYPECKGAAEALDRKISTHTNLFVRQILPKVWDNRERELRSEAFVAMLHAALEMRLDPAKAASAIANPNGTGPFLSTRFLLDGSDRGFKLKSNLPFKQIEPAIIFTEKTGPGFMVMGAKIGQKVP